MVLSNHLPDGSETGWKQVRFIGKPFGQSIIWHVATKLLQSVLLSWCCRMAPLTRMLLWVVLCTKKQLRCMEICYGQGNKSVSSLWEQKGSHKGRHCGRTLLQTTQARWEGEQNLPQKKWSKSPECRPWFSWGLGAWTPLTVVEWVSQQGANK